MIQRSKTQEMWIKAYLIVYNSLQTLGWSILLLQIIQYCTFTRTDGSLYDHIKWTVIIAQNAAILEVAHSALKFVVSNPIITLQQVASRVMLVCGVLMPTMAARESSGLLLMLLAWSITEIVRYSYYALNLMNKVPYILTWLRYSTFVILYPLGVTGELLCLSAAAQEIRKTNMWSIDFPNKWNVMFHYEYFLIFVMCLYVPLFPQMFMHMVHQRKKVLGVDKGIKAE